MGDQNKRVFRAKTAGRELLETNPLDFTVVQLLWNSQVIMAGESLTVRNPARFARGLTERHALWAKLSSKKRQTKPIEISHKSLALKELTSIHSDLLVQNEPNSGSLQDGRSEGYTTIGSRYADEPGRLRIGWPRMTRNGTERPGNCVRTRHGSKAGYSSGVAGVEARRATPPDPRPPRWGLAGCCQLDPSHPTIVTCAVGREGRHAPRPNDVGGQPRFPGARKGVTLPRLVISGLAIGPPAGVGDGLRFLSTR